MEQNALTPEGKKKLEEFLAHRRDVMRHQIIKDIEEARAHGDLSENSEYHDARERHSMNEGLIKHLENYLSSAVVIDVTTKEPPKGEERRIVFGCTVVLIEYDDDGEEVPLKDEKGNILEDENGEPLVEQTLRLVGVEEVDLKANKISYKSPIGKALMGHAEGETIDVPVPTGVKTFEIVQVLYR